MNKAVSKPEVVKLFGIERSGNKTLYLHKNSITGFWESDAGTNDVMCGVMLTNGAELSYSGPLANLISCFEGIIEFQLPNDNTE